jgi:hypothetical protein
LQQIHHHRGEDLSVSLDDYSILHGHHGQADPPGGCIQSGGRNEVVDKSGHEESLWILDALGQTNLRERPPDERAQTIEAALEHGPGAPCNAHSPSEHLRAMIAVFVNAQSESETESRTPARGFAIERELVARARIR